MSESDAPTTAVSPLHLPHLEALLVWLTQQGIDHTTWGQAGSKQPAHLWAEIAAGESVLYAHPPRRRLTLVQVNIRQGHHLLIEAEQELADGRRRSRQIPLAEKLHAGEDVLSGARRALYEELGADPTTVTVELAASPPQVRMRLSPSYPGLLTEYVVHMVTAVVPGLPTTPFWRDNLAPPGDPVRRQLWVWQEEPSMDSPLPTSTSVPFPQSH